MELHCPLCNDWFRDPLMLSCGHNFCQSCIQNFWKQQAKETFCPECKMLCQYSNCTFNLVLEKLVEKIKKLPLLKGHPQCPEHGENLKLFSKPDGKLICFQCKDARLSVGQSKEFLQISDAVRFFMVGEPWVLSNLEQFLSKAGKKSFVGLLLSSNTTPLFRWLLESSECSENTTYLAKFFFYSCQL